MERYYINGQWRMAETIYSVQISKVPPSLLLQDFAPSANSSQFLFGEKTTHLDGKQTQFFVCAPARCVFLLSDMEIDDKIPPLSHIAAKHKIAIKPKRTHGAPRLRRINTVSSLHFLFW
jgi:hypothetical protein